MDEERRYFVLAGLSAALAGNSTANAGQPAQPSYLCVYRPGEKWLAGRPLSEQPLREHGRYMLDLYRRGILRLAGPFADGSGGAVLFGADDDASAAAIVAADPAVTAHIFTYELRRWTLVDWEAVGKR
jgi:hypothetical protein